MKSRLEKVLPNLNNFRYWFINKTLVEGDSIRKVIIDPVNKCLLGLEDISESEENLSESIRVKLRKNSKIIEAYFDLLLKIIHDVRDKKNSITCEVFFSFY